MMKLIEDNAREARKAREQKQTVAKRQADYDDHNVFSYIFENKVHQSHALRQKNEAAVNMIKD